MEGARRVEGGRVVRMGCSEESSGKGLVVFKSIYVPENVEPGRTVVRYNDK